MRRQEIRGVKNTFATPREKKDQSKHMGKYTYINAKSCIVLGFEKG